MSDTENNPPFAKAEDREAMLKAMDEVLGWIKKSAKREDIKGNNEKIILGLKRLHQQTGVDIPVEAWVRIQQTTFFKDHILKK